MNSFAVSLPRQVIRVGLYVGRRPIESDTSMVSTTVQPHLDGRPGP